MKVRGGMVVELHRILTSTLDGELRDRFLSPRSINSCGKGLRYPFHRRWEGPTTKLAASNMDILKQIVKYRK